jgi:sirohydrochlorin cobaltochelatase
MGNNFSDSALVLVGHGSTVNADSAAPVWQHAGALRRRHIFDRVQEAFWKQEPYLAEVLRAISAPRVFVVPLFVSDGYFTEEIIPRELGLCAAKGENFPRVQQRGGQTLHYCRPVGTHPGMTDVLLARARQVVEQYPFPRAPKTADTALFIAGHGTSQNEKSRQAIEQQVELIRAKKLYAEVYPAFLEEEPRISDCYKTARARNIVMVPFFISNGLHVREDIPVMLGAPKDAVQECLKAGRATWRNPTEREGKRLWYAASIGSEPLMAEVILQRVAEASE